MTADTEAEGTTKLLELQDCFTLSSFCEMHTGVKGRNLHDLAMLAGLSVITQWCMSCTAYLQIADNIICPFQQQVSLLSCTVHVALKGVVRVSGTSSGGPESCRDLNGRRAV